MRPIGPVDPSEPPPIPRIDPMTPPADRAALVAALRTLVDEGDYQVDSELVAIAVMKEGLFRHHSE